jgi:hypothetical protein
VSREPLDRGEGIGLATQTGVASDSTDWRISAIAIAVTTALLSVAAISCGSTEQGGPTIVAGVQLEPGDLRLTSFAQIPGTNHLYAALTHGGYSDYGLSDGRTEAKDLLFFDATTKGARWLLGDPAKKLRSYALILDPPPSIPWARFAEQVSENTKALGLLFEAVPQNPEESGRAAGDQAEIGLANADGSAPVILVPGVSRVLGHHLVNRDSLVVFYVRGGELWAVDISPATRAVRTNAVVSTSP